MALGTGFSGHLSIVSLREVLTKLHVAGETGRLCLFTPMARATVWLRAGNVVDAEIGARTGESALDVLSILSDGTFTFFAEASARDGAVTPAETLAKNWAAKEGRVSALMTKLPSLIDALTWDDQVMETIRKEHPSHRSLLSAMRSGATLLEALIEVDVELVSALELFIEAIRAQSAKTTSGAKELAPFGSRTLLHGASRPAAEPSASNGAIVGVRPRRTVLGADKVSLALSSQVEPPQLDATPEVAVPKVATENMMARTLVGVPMADIRAMPEVNVAKSDPPADPKARGRRFSQRAPEATSPTLDALTVGDVLELVPETVRHTAQPGPNHEPDKKSDSDTPPPSSMDGGAIVLAGRRLARVSLLSDAARFAVQLVSDTSKSDGSEMALKMPRRQDPATYAALQAESAILGAVSHPNLVRLAQSGVDVDMPFLLTWYWPGVTLAELAALNRPLPVGLVVCVVRQVLDAASALHDPTNPRGGFVHCNLCPDNVLVGFDGVVRVCGLSNARRVKSKIDDEDLSVHAQYAPPELLRGQRVDERSDVFSAGMLLGLALRGGVKQDSPDLAQVRAVWTRATDAIAAQRYPNARDFGLALDRFDRAWGPSEVADWLAKEMAQIKLEAVRSASPSPGSRWTKRRTLAVVLGVSLVLLVAVVLAVVFKR